MKVEKDLCKAKSGRWVFLIGGKPKNPEKESVRWPSVTLARWLKSGHAGCWTSVFNERWESPIGFMEVNDITDISDLDLLESEVSDRSC